MSTSIMNAVKRALEGRGFKRGIMGGSSSTTTNTAAKKHKDDNDNDTDAKKKSDTQSTLSNNKKRKKKIEILEIIDSSDDDNAPTVPPPAFTTTQSSKTPRKLLSSLPLPTRGRRKKRRRDMDNSSSSSSSGSNSSSMESSKISASATLSVFDDESDDNDNDSETSNDDTETNGSKKVAAVNLTRSTATRTTRSSPGGYESSIRQATRSSPVIRSSPTRPATRNSPSIRGRRTSTKDTLPMKQEKDMKSLTHRAESFSPNNDDDDDDEIEIVDKKLATMTAAHATSPTTKSTRQRNKEKKNGVTPPPTASPTTRSTRQKITDRENAATTTTTTSTHNPSPTVKSKRQKYTKQENDVTTTTTTATPAISATTRSTRQKSAEKVIEPDPSETETELEEEMEEEEEDQGVVAEEEQEQEDKNKTKEKVPSLSSPSNVSPVGQLPERDESGHLSNIAHVKPWVGMKLEIRDTDYIWSAARLVKVSEEEINNGNGKRKNKDSNHKDLFVTVHCEGWDSDQWDERLPWPSSRLARLYTYTKRVKCLVSLLPKVKSRKGCKPAKGRKLPTTLWPCTVQIRMPHPVKEEGCDDEERCLLAEELLKLEEKAFVQPYGIPFLPPWIIDSLDVDKGRWFNVNKLKLWRYDPQAELGALPKHFMTAFQEAVNDREITGYLPARLFVKGSLVDDFFRVRTREGENLGGALRQGTIPKLPPKNKLSPRPSLVTSSKQQDDESSMSKMVDDRVETEPEEDSREAMLRKLRLKYEPPPSFPPGMRLAEPIYPGVTRCKTSDGWVASISISGNDEFLGTYPTQTQAWMATKLMASQPSDKDDEAMKKLMMTDGDDDSSADAAAKIADMKAIPIESIIEATEREYKPDVHNFSLHEWTIQKIRHTAYQKQIRKYEQPQEEDQGGKATKNNKDSNDEAVLGVWERPDDPNQGKKKGRKQRQPRKVDLEAHSYNQS